MLRRGLFGRSASQIGATNAQNVRRQDLFLQKHAKTAENHYGQVRRLKAAFPTIKTDDRQTRVRHSPTRQGFPFLAVNSSVLPIFICQYSTFNFHYSSTFPLKLFRIIPKAAEVRQVDWWASNGVDWRDCRDWRDWHQMADRKNASVGRPWCVSQTGHRGKFLRRAGSHPLLGQISRNFHKYANVYTLSSCCLAESHAYRWLPKRRISLEISKRSSNI
jgi:hypothetical protein